MHDTAPGPGADVRLLDALAGLVEAALARLLRLDAGSDPLLARLDGRQLRLALRGAPRGLRLAIADGRVRPVPDDDRPADLSLAMEPAALLAWLARPQAERGLPSGARIEGDLELARVLERALAGFDPDWSLPFIDLLGPTLGPQVGRGLASALAYARGQAGNLAGSAAEFATEEARLVAARAEIDDFNGAVDLLRDDVERLAARIARLDRASRG